MRNNNQNAPLEIFAGTLVKLHKVLKEEDQLRNFHRARENGEEAISPVIVIDFNTVTSIQEDYKRNGTIIMDKKTAVVVEEDFHDVLDAWIDVREGTAQ